MRKPAAVLVVALLPLLMPGLAIAGPAGDASKESNTHSNLGDRHQYSQGSPQDHTEAAMLYRQASEKGDPSAQYLLGVIYAKGIGVAQDYAEAEMWYRRAAEQGNVYAQFHLAMIYIDGRWVPPDYIEGVKWYRRAAEQGLAHAQYNLGLRYYLGQGVPQDYVLAHMWFNLATSRFPASGAEMLDISLKSRNLLASKMTPDQIAEAQRLAREWKPKKER